MDKETKLRIHNITAKAALKFGSEAWVLKKREERSLEAAQMKFLRHLLGITKLDKEKKQCIRGKTGAQNIVKEIKQYQKKWLQHVQTAAQSIQPNYLYIAKITIMCLLIHLLLSVSYLQTCCHNTLFAKKGIKL